MVERRRVSAVLHDFDRRIDGLVRLDALNQQRFRAGPGRPGAAVFSKGQMILITEGVFIRAFSSYELFLEEVFILFARGKPTASGIAPTRYINPRDGKHARELLKSGMHFLEWNSPDTLIARAETYLDGGTVKQAITQYRNRLQSIRRVRNAIAHRSDEAWSQYSREVGNELRVAPLQMLEPGEFLMTTDPRTRNQHFLLTYLAVLKDVASIAAG